MTNEEFSYKVIQQNETIVISFSGVLNGRSLKKIDECVAKLHESKYRFLILDFKNTTKIESTAYRHLVQLQHMVRKVEGCTMRLCGVNPAWKSELIDQGVIRGSEITNTLKSALNDFGKLEDRSQH